MILYENYLVIGAKLLICFIRFLDVIYKIILNAVNDFDFARGGVARLGITLNTAVVGYGYCLVPPLYSALHKL